MQLNDFTIKAQEVLQQAQKIASERNQQVLDPLHVLLAMLEQPEGITTAIVKKIGAPLVEIKQEVTAAIETLPHVSGTQVLGQVSLSKELGELMAKAQEEEAKLKDEYISTEHVLLAATNAPKLQKLLEKYGINYDNVLKVLTDVRGNQRVTDQNPEEKYQALEKYSQNLTAQARQVISQGKPGGRFILSSGCCLGRDTSPENVDAMTRACEDYGAYD